METGAGEADEGAEFGRSPLRGGGAAVAAGGVGGAFLEDGELFFSFRGGADVRRNNSPSLTEEGKKVGGGI